MSNESIVLRSNVKFFSNIYCVSVVLHRSPLFSIYFYRKENKRKKQAFIYVHNNLLWRHLVTFLRSHWNVKLLKPVLTIYSLQY